MFKSLLVNLLSLTSIYFFDLLLLPLTKEHEHWLRRNVGWFYQALWLFPVVGVSLYLNVSTSSFGRFGLLRVCDTQLDSACSPVQMRSPTSVLELVVHWPRETGVHPPARLARCRGAPVHVHRHPQLHRDVRVPDSDDLHVRRRVLLAALPPPGRARPRLCVHVLGRRVSSISVKRDVTGETAPRARVQILLL